MTGTDTDHGDFGWIGEKRGANHLFDLRLCHALRPNGNRLAALSCTVGVRDVFGMLSLKKRPAGARGGQHERYRTRHVPPLTVRLPHFAIHVSAVIHVFASVQLTSRTYAGSDCKAEVIGEARSIRMSRSLAACSAIRNGRIRLSASTAASVNHLELS